MGFDFVSGNPALDFAATVLSRRGAPVDLLVGPADLEQWMTACEHTPERITVDGAAFEAALLFREAIYQLALARVEGRPFDPDCLNHINRVATEPVPVIRLDARGLQSSGDLPAALSLIARSGMVALADPDACFKECRGPDCGRIYLDRSRGARRTWCGMSLCGNRINAAAYRARKRAGATLSTQVGSEDHQR